MADDRLVLGLASWLRDSDAPAPDARMSATRVMAGVEVTPRLGRLWPPARFAPPVEPAPALGAFGPAGPPPRPVPRVQKPRIKARLRAVFTPIRVLAVANIAALTVSVALIVASMLPSGAAPRSAVIAPLPSEPASMAPATAATPVPSPTPAPTAEPTWAPSERALDWHTDSVRLEAEAVTLAIADERFTAPESALATGRSGAQAATLAGGWFEGGTEQQLVVQLASDGDSWWIERIRTFDGRPDSGWLDFENLAARTATPVGAAWEGDLRLKSTDAERKAYRKPGSGVLQFTGLRLTAFDPLVPQIEAATE